MSLCGTADAYVNEAFGASHRSHASIVGPPRVLPSAAGLLLEREVAVLSRLVDDPARPFVAVLGGAKVSDKLGVIEALLDRCDTILVGGAMAFTFEVARGGNVGDSLVEPDMVDTCRRLLDTCRVQIPTDVVVAEDIAADAPTQIVPADRVPDGWKGLDVGPETTAAYAAAVAPRPRCSGTDRWGCSRSRRSPRARAAWPRLSPHAPASLSWVAATARLRSASSGSPTESTT